MKYVVDSSAIFSCAPLPPADELCTVTGVLEEISHGGRVRKHLDFLLAAGLEVREPGKDAIARVHDIATKSGDSSRLSQTDISILALALELNAPILTDDYSIQNMARLLSIEWLPIAQKGIKKTLEWSLVCSGCKRPMSDSEKECIVCGKQPKTTIKRRKNKL